MDKKILSNEIEWHGEHVVNSWKPTKFSLEGVDKYRLNKNWKVIPKQFMFHKMGKLTDKKVLDFGSGQGINGVQMALLGADVTGLELHPDLVKLSNKLAKINDVSETCRFIEAEVTAYPIESQSYDLVVIDNVLHHIPIEYFDDIFNKLSSGLKPAGIFVIREPIALAKIITVIKNIVPYNSNDSPDERELIREDLNRITSLIDITEIKYFSFFERMFRVFGLSFLRKLGFSIDNTFSSVSNS